MNIRFMMAFLKPLVTFSLTSVIFICMGLSLPATAGNAANNSPVVQVSLDSDTIVLGEPVTLTYKIVNNTGTTVDTFMGRDKREWLALDLTGTPRKTMPERVKQDNSVHGGLYGSGVSVSPNSTVSGKAIVNQQFRISQPGTYQLAVHVRLPYNVGQPPTGIQRITGTADDYENVYTNEYLFSLVVMPPDAARLRATAQGLQESIAEKGIAERIAVIESLFSMPEAEALPSWQALARDPKLDSLSLRTVAKQLARLNTMRSVELLADMIENPAQSPAVQRDAQIGLEFMGASAQGSDSPLKRRAGKFFTDHGMAPPKTPISAQD